MDKAEYDLHADVEQRHWWFTGRRRIMQRLIREVAPPGEAATVLDVGCGTGANIASLSDDYRAVGVDASQYAITHATRAFPDVEFHCTADDGELAKLAGKASVITIMDVLEHVDDDYAMLSKLLAAAQPGSHFLITVPANLSLWSKHDEVFGHWRRYDRGQLAGVWSGLDVECRLLSYFNTRLYPAVRMIRTRKRRREETTDRHESDLKIPIAPLNAMLHRIFAGEAGRLLRSLDGDEKYTYQQGVSLVAVLRRGAGAIEPRPRPADATPDYYDPVAKRYLEQHRDAEALSHP